MASHIGTVVLFDERHFNKTLALYNKFADELRPLLSAYNACGLPPLTGEQLGRLSSINSGSELILTLSRSYYEVAKSENPGLDETDLSLLAHSFQLNLFHISNFIKTNTQFLDCPFEEGLPLVTPEFKSLIRSRFETKPSTDQQSDFYDAFLAAQDALQAMEVSGAIPGVHFKIQGLEITLLSLPS